MKKLTLNNFFLFVVFCLPTYLIKISIFGLPTNLLELLALLTILLTIKKEGVYFFKKIISLPKKFLIGCSMLLGGILLSIFLNNEILVGIGILKGWFLIPIFFSFALYLNLKTTSDLKKVFVSIFLSSGLVGLISLIYKITAVVTYDNRLKAFYLSPNHLAMYLTPGAIFGTYFLIKSFSKKPLPKISFLYLFSNLFILIALYFTYSYGAWISLLLSFIIGSFFLLSSKNNASKIFFFFIFLFSILIILQIKSEKFSALANLSPRSSLSSRQTIWKASFLLIKENPIFGIGPGNFQKAYLSLQPKFEPYLEWAVPQPHNIFLAFWLQAGIIGFAGFSMLLIFIFQKSKQFFLHKKNAVVATPLFVFFAYTIIHGLVDTTYWKNDLAFLFWICFFLVLFFSDKISKEKL